MRPLKDKKGPAFKDILRERRLYLQSFALTKDKAYNSVLTDYSIEHIYFQNTLKKAERANKTIKTCIVTWHSNNPNNISIVYRNLLGAATKHTTVLLTTNLNWFNQATKKRCAYLDSYHEISPINKATIQVQIGWISKISSLFHRKYKQNRSFSSKVEFPVPFTTLSWYKYDT